LKNKSVPFSVDAATLIDGPFTKNHFQALTSKAGSSLAFRQSLLGSPHGPTDHRIMDAKKIGFSFLVNNIPWHKPIFLCFQ